MSRVLVTGAASGIGKACVERFIAAGCRVAVNFLPGDERGKHFVASLTAEGYDVFGAPGDISDEPSVLAMIESVVDRFGKLDALVCNAGTPGVTHVIPSSRLDLLTDDVWEKVWRTNVLGTFWCVRAAKDHLADGAGVVNTASLAGLDAPGSSMAYAASKAAVVNLTKNLARALGPHARVNAVAPGLVTSDWPLEGIAAREEATAQAALLNRVSAPDDIAGVIEFLALHATTMTGQTLTVDGGFSLADPRAGSRV
ncbi:SDR family oxidoreductase [Amycolatopsis acidicola]|uniref:SDR family oxidoreductase n=1 Tax=Amycolatopsis acidicola TaxID=2596893 RepID=A0A5N0VDI2_9PSEU|nr:SDR family oxidoreductase [Amycolatopsis acidicola]KAA9164399.1 SDR family oxidoreductase [Amycolatopsis acidicola]